MIDASCSTSRRRSSTRRCPRLKRDRLRARARRPARRRSTRRRLRDCERRRRRRARTRPRGVRGALRPRCRRRRARSTANAPERAAAGPTTGLMRRPPIARSPRRRRAKGRGERATPRRGGPQLRLERRRSRARAPPSPRWRDGAPSSEHRSTKGTPAQRARATKTVPKTNERGAGRPTFEGASTSINPFGPTLTRARARAARRRSASHARLHRLGNSASSSATPDPRATATPQRRGRREHRAGDRAAGETADRRERACLPHGRGDAGRREDTEASEHRRRAAQSPRRDAHAPPPSVVAMTSRAIADADERHDGSARREPHVVRGEHARNLAEFGARYRADRERRAQLSCRRMVY